MKSDPEELICYRSFASALHAGMRKSGLSAYEVAKRSGVAQAILSRFLNGGGDIRLETADKLAKALCVTVVDLEQFQQAFRARWKTWFRAASRRHHPDHGGSNERQIVLNEVKAAIEKMAGFAPRARSRRAGPFSRRPPRS